jgi:hypothetical protein
MPDPTAAERCAPASPLATPQTPCEGCLDEMIPCHCGEVIRAGDGHPDCSQPWFGYWLCVECGHCTRHHSDWWDDGHGHSGGGCVHCDCGDPVGAWDLAGYDLAPSVLSPQDAQEDPQ